MQKSKSIILTVSATVILLSAIAFLFVPKIASWAMIVGVCAFSSVTASTPYPGKSIRGKRLFGIQLIACALMFIAAYLMFRERNEWALPMIISAILLFYTAIVIPKELSKEQNETHSHS